MKREKLKIDKVLFLVLFSALVVRVAGIGWGFPSTLNNEESSVVRAALGFRFGDFAPRYLDWPTLYQYFLFGIFWLFIKFRVPFQLLFGVETMRRVLPFWWASDPLPFYFLARLTTAILGTATVAAVYLIGRKIGDRKTALVAALFLALHHGSVINSQIATLDVAMTFLLTVSFYFTLRIFERGSLKDYVLAGLFAGLSASTKYNGGAVVVAIIAAHLLRIGPIGPIRPILLAGLVAIGGFLVGTPYVLLNYEMFLSHEEHGFLWTFWRTAPSFNYPRLLEIAFLRSWGLFLTLLAFLGWGLRLRRAIKGDRSSWLLLIFPTLYLLYVGSWSGLRSHYTLPLLPFFALFAAEAFWFLSNRLPIKRTFLTTIFLSLLLIYPTFKIFKLDISKIRGDTRTVARFWIEKTIPRGTAFAGEGYTETGIYGGLIPEIPDYPTYMVGSDLKRGDFSLDFLERQFGNHRVKYAIESSYYYGHNETEARNLSQYRNFVRQNGELVKTLSPAQWYFGPTIRIYKMRRNENF